MCSIPSQGTGLVPMIEELGRHGYKLSAGTLYPMLQARGGADIWSRPRNVLAAGTQGPTPYQRRRASHERGEPRWGPRLFASTEIARCSKRRTARPWSTCPAAGASAPRQRGRGRSGARGHFRWIRPSSRPARGARRFGSIPTGSRVCARLKSTSTREGKALSGVCRLVRRAANRALQ